MPTKICTIHINPKDYIYENNGQAIYLIKKDSKRKFNNWYWFPNRDYYKLVKDIEDKTIFD